MDGLKEALATLFEGMKNREGLCEAIVVTYTDENGDSYLVPLRRCSCPKCTRQHTEAIAQYFQALAHGFYDEEDGSRVVN